MAARFSLRPLRRALSSPVLARPAPRPRLALPPRLRQLRAVSSSAGEAIDAGTDTSDLPDSIPDAPNGAGIDWSRSYHGLATEPFAKEIVAALMQPINDADVEIKPDGICYLPEIKYRRIMHQAFGPGGWGLVPKGPVVVGDKVVTREYVLIAHGRFISQAQGENQYFSADALPSAVEGVKSNALVRCCKDLGVASELWDPTYLRAYKKKHAEEVWVEHITLGKKRQIWIRKGGDVPYPYKRAVTTAAKAAPAKPAAKRV